VLALLLLVAGDTAVMAQHGQGDKLRHHLRHHLVTEPRDRYMRWDRRVGENRVDPGTEISDQLEVRQRCQLTWWRLPHQRGLNVGQIAKIGRDPDIEFGHLGLQGLRPRHRIVETAGKQQSAGHSYPPMLKAIDFRHIRRLHAIALRIIFAQ
jgi:hypothetical protein